MATTPLNPYSVQAHYPDVPYLADRDYWLDICNDRLEFCRGFLQCRIDLPLPRVALRLVRHKDSKVLVSVPAHTGLGCGMVAGYPTGPQQIEAIRRNLERVRFHKGYVSTADEIAAQRALAVLL